jgi:WD40 repeat protein
MDITPDGSMGVIPIFRRYNSLPGVVYFVDLDNFQLIDADPIAGGTNPVTFDTSYYRARSATISPDGSEVVVGFARQWSLKRISLADFSVTTMARSCGAGSNNCATSARGVSQVKFGPDGRLYEVRRIYGGFNVWNGASWVKKSEPDRDVAGVVFSNDGLRYFVLSDIRNRVYVYDINDDSLITSFPANLSRRTEGVGITPF